MNDTLVKTGQAIPKMIAILDYENDRVLIRSFTGNDRECFQFLISLGCGDSSDYITGNFELDIDN